MGSYIIGVYIKCDFVCSYIYISTWVQGGGGGGGGGRELVDYTDDLYQ